jgi:hypothetical protein
VELQSTSCSRSVGHFFYFLPIHSVVDFLPWLVFVTMDFYDADAVDFDTDETGTQDEVGSVGVQS